VLLELAQMTHGGDIFAIAAARGWDWRDLADFSASINPLGPAPGVQTAICKAIQRIRHYPEREPKRVREALSAKWNVDPDSILLGNGATELIFFLVRMFGVRPITLAAPVFSEFHRAFPHAHLASVSRPESWHSEQALVLTRPANPTGTSIAIPAIRERLERSRERLVVDESFLEFSGLPSVSTLLPTFPQLVVLRSLTKFYALPGLRLGALVTHPSVLADWRRHREPWQVNVLAEEAALAALADDAHSNHTIDFVRQEREFLIEQIKAIPGARPHPTDANFIYVSLRHRAQDLVDYLLGSKILIRNCADWPGLPGEALRIAVRTRNENERLIRAWRDFQCA
jgi:threonine-phosphate decarboxylase